MAKTREWLFNTSTGMPVRVTLNKNKLVSVNGSPETKVMALKSPESNFAERVFDIPLGNGEIAKLCVRNKQVLVYNGRNVETGEEYKTIQLPKWVYVFVVLYIVNFFVLLGGALGGATSAIGAYASANISADEKRNTLTKVLFCVLLYLGISIVSFLLAYAAGKAFQL
ncbi:hypothetical protein [Butyrivibrio hungatei]|uniref:hypothetical protein n=1 Tax=Butyrivibrio hungatei TaxID=185008 RepID=UPI0004141206|nr:hypothetical protein [Butyrivibrio hungatei]